jgi:transposase
MSTSTDDYRRAPRRRFDKTTKLRILAACDTPGATVAKVAQANGINVNLLHKWRREQAMRAGSREAAKPARAITPADAVGAFVPIALPASAGDDIRIALRRGATSIEVRWPRSAAGDCAAWLRELLR